MARRVILRTRNNQVAFRGRVGIGWQAEPAGSVENDPKHTLADVRRAAPEVAIGYLFDPLQCVILSLGESNEPTLQSRRQTNQTTSQADYAKAPQRAQGDA